MERAQRMGEGSIPRLLATFSLPAIVGMMAQAMYYVVDRIFVGHGVGSDGIAGMTIAFPFMLILMAFGMLIGFGANALVSIRLGQRRRDEAELVLGNAAVLLVVVSIVLSTLGLAFLDPLLTIFGASPTVLPLAREYLEVLVAGTIFQTVGFGLNAIIRSEGNPPIAMLTLLIGVALNVVLAPIFIFGLGWGMRGAAAATVLSQAVSAVWVVSYFLGRKSLLKLRLANLRLDASVCRSILVIGSPPFAMQLSASAMNGILNNQLDAYGGDLAVSVMGVIYAVAMMVAMPMFGINQGAQPIIGFNYGAQRFDRVRQTVQTAVLAASTIALAGFVAAMFFPEHVVRLFNDEDQALIHLGSHAMRTSLAMLPVIGFQIVGASYFQAVGKPREAMLLSLSRQVLILIPAVLLLPRFFGLDGLWLAMPTADLSSSILTGGCLLVEMRHLQRRHVGRDEG